MSEIKVPFTVGQVSATLTSIEFAIGGLALFTLPRLTSKILYLRNRSNSGLVTVDTIRKARTFVQCFGFSLALLFTISIAMVEVDLKGKQFVSTNVFNTTNWLEFNVYHSRPSFFF